MENNQQLATKEYLNNSKRTLQFLTSAVAQGGKLISGTNLTLQKIYEGNEGTVGLLVKNGMSTEVRGIYMVCLKELWVHADTLFTSESINELSHLLMNQYPHHRPQELIIAIKNGMTGKYGKTYGKLSTMEVMRWVKEYDETDRADFFEQKATQKPKEDWRAIDPELIKPILDKTPKPKEQPKPNPVNEWAQQVMRDFDKGAKMKHGAMFFEIAGQDGEPLYLNIDEYLQYRFKNQDK